MKKLLICLAVAILAACGGAPPPESGYVIERRFTPAHWKGGWESYTVMVYECRSKDGYVHPVAVTIRECDYEPETHTRWEDHHQWIDDDWQLKLEDCDLPEGDKKPKCKSGWRSVSEREYENFPVGVHYPTHVKETRGRP